MASSWTKNMLPCQFVDFSDQIYILLSPWNPSTVLIDPLPTPHSPLRRERVGGYRSPSPRGRFRPGRRPPPAPLGSIYLCRSSLPPRVVAPPLHWPPPSSGSIGVAWGGPSRESRYYLLQPPIQFGNYSVLSPFLISLILLVASEIWDYGISQFGGWRDLTRNRYSIWLQIIGSSLLK